MLKQVLEVKIDDIKIDQAIKIVEGWLGKSGKHYIVTPNPEFLVTASEDSRFKSILNDADLAIPDGIGLKVLGGIKNRIPGVDFMESLCQLAEEKTATVGLLGGRDGVAKKTAECLKNKYPGLNISFVNQDESIAASQIPQTDILFVALGHPKQEKWISENLGQLKVKVAMGVGGSFDYISGKVHRAPQWIRTIWLEWLFRLIVQPWRIKRQLKLLKYVWLIMVHSK